MQSLDFESSGSGEIPECELSAYGCCSDGVTRARRPNGGGCPDKAEKVRGVGAELPAEMPTPAKPPSTKQHFTVSRTQSTSAKPPSTKHHFTISRTQSTSTKLPSTKHHFTISRTQSTKDHIVTSTHTDSPTTTASIVKFPTPAVATARLPTTTTTAYLPTTTTQTSTEYPTPVPRFHTSPLSETVTTTTAADDLTARVRHVHPSVVSCLSSAYGCCLDGKTAAAGPNLQGCPWDEDRYLNTCEDTPYGCCADGITAASGPNNAHCPHLLQRAGQSFRGKLFCTRINLTVFVILGLFIGFSSPTNIARFSFLMMVKLYIFLSFVIALAVGNQR